MINPLKAKKAAERIFRDRIPELYAEYYLIHSKYVIKAAKELTKEKNLNLNTKIFEIAGWLHDTGYAVKAEEHAEESINLVEKDFPNTNKIIRDCIRNHSVDKTPLTQEGKIFQLADKLGMFYPEYIKKLIAIEKKEGKLKEKEIIEKQKKRMEKYLNLFEDEDFKRLANKYFKKFIGRYRV